MTTSGFDPELVPLNVSVDDAMIRVKFHSGLEVATPVSRFPRLQRATPAQRKEWRLIGKGDGIHWPGVDEDISVKGLFSGVRPVASTAMDEVPSLIRRLYETTNRLNELFMGRPFTPDGHLVGSIGEVVAEYIYGVKLEPCSTAGIDARTDDGRTVQIKLTGENGMSYGFRWSNKDEMKSPDLLICMKLTKQGFTEVYNGPFPADWLRTKPDQKNGQISLGIKRLRLENRSLLPMQRSFDSINRWFASSLSEVA